MVGGVSAGGLSDGAGAGAGAGAGTRARAARSWNRALVPSFVRRVLCGGRNGDAEVDADGRKDVRYVPLRDIGEV